MSADNSRLTLTREIARSAITTVWEGYDTGLDRKVLVKAIHPQYARETDLRARLEREARAIARVSHPNVVQIFDLRTDGEDLSLLLEFVDGATLGKLLKDRGPLPQEVALTICCAILSGLEAAHAAAIIHRDLKPDNVLVSERGEVKITDFGLASLADQPTVTLAGMVLGTPSYMSPEQAAGGDVGAATDVFATGLILFEMLTGERLIAGNSLGEAYQNALRFQTPKLDEWPEQIDELLQLTLRKMLERAPEKRLSSAAEARAVLLRLLPNGPLPNTLIADFLSGETIQRASPGSFARAKNWTKPLRTLLLTMFVVIGVLIVLQFAAHLNTGDIPRTDSTRVADSTLAEQPADCANVVARVPDTVYVDRPAENNGSARQDSLARIVPPVEKPASTADGYLVIVSKPWARVFVHDSLIGATPLATPLKLMSGAHGVVLVNPEIGLPVTRTVQIAGNDTTFLEVNLYDFVARIKITTVKPWADVYIDDEFVLKTPSAQLIFRPLGLHRITLKNPNYPAFTLEVPFRQEDAVYEVRHDFTEL
jgi:serine/threonine-protein kinase